MISTTTKRNRPRHRLTAAIGTAVAVFGALTASAAGPAAADSRFDTPLVEMTPELESKVREKIEQFQVKYSVPGMSVAVVTPSPHGNEPVITRFSVGTPTLGSSIPVDASTQFEIGSETKVFTSDLLAYLIADGRVSLDDPVQKYAPAGTTVPVWTDPNTRSTTEITLRDLATHQAGLPDSPLNYWEPCDGVENCTNPQPDYTQEMLWRGLAEQDLYWQPGTNWLYSNFGFGLLGTILANVISPTPETEPPAYLSALEGAFLHHLQMSSTMLGTGPNIASPYTFDNAPSYYWDDTNALAGEGGLVSDTDDMATWVAAHLGYTSSDAPLGVRSMVETLRPVSTITTTCSEPTECQPVTDFQMGLAWQLYPAASNHTGADWAFKNGGTAGFSTDTTLAPSKGVGVTTMWNQGRLTGPDREPGIELLSFILNYVPEPVPDPGHGHHDRPRLAESGTDASVLLASAVGGAALLLAGGLLLSRRRRSAIAPDDAPS